MSATALRVKPLSKAAQKKETAARKLKPLGTGMMLPGLVAEQRRMLAARDSSQVANTRVLASEDPYLGEPLIAARPGATDALQVASLVDGKRTQYKPPAAYCVGSSKILSVRST